MRIRYTKHSLDRLKERGVSKRDVKKALQKGNKMSAQGGSMRCSFRTSEGDNLVIIFNLKGIADFEIITAYYL